MCAIGLKRGLRLGLLHVHHGETQDVELRDFRDRAQRLVEDWSRAEYDLRVVRAQPASQSEESLRECRRMAIQQLRVDFPDSLVALGHHADDLFETRLIRLLRGTGPQGLAAMQFFDPESRLFRPLLLSSRRSIEGYVSETRGAKEARPWLDDPSNQDLKYLRNSVRKKLIPLLDELRPGGAENFAKSLELISPRQNPDDVNLGTSSSDASRGSLSREWLQSQPLKERREHLAEFMLKNGIKDFTKNQIEEILKRIDSPRKRLTFSVAGRKWVVDSQIRI